MKKVLFFALALTAIATQSQAQFYLKAGVGYAFPHAGQTLDNTGFPYSGTVTDTRFEMDKASYTSGFQGTIGAGYFFSKNVGVELNAVLGIATKKHELDYSESFGGAIFNSNYVTYSKLPIILNPSVVLRTSGTSFNLYTRAGLALPVKNKVYGEVEMTESSGSGITTETYEYEQKNTLGIGFSGALGASYNVSSNISLWLEASLLSVSVYAKEAEITNYTVDGINVTPLIPADERIIRYEKEGTFSATSNVAPTYALPYSNIGINFGVAFSL